MTDPLITVLNRAGYMPVFLPRSGLVPPDVMLYERKERRLTRYGALAELAPAVKRIRPTPSDVAPIQGFCRTEKSARTALGFLKSALRVIGIDSAPRLDFGFASSFDLIFSFLGVTGREIDLLKLNDVLKMLRLKGLPADKVAEGHAHLAYGYLYAKQLEVRRTDGKDFEFGAKGRVGDFIDLGQRAKVKTKSGVAILFEAQGKALPAFAYKAARLMPQDGGGFIALAEQTHLRATRSGVPGTPYLPLRDAVLEVGTHRA